MLGFLRLNLFYMIVSCFSERYFNIFPIPIFEFSFSIFCFVFASPYRQHPSLSLVTSDSIVASFSISDTKKTSGEKKIQFFLTWKKICIRTKFKSQIRSWYQINEILHDIPDNTSVSRLETISTKTTKTTFNTTTTSAHV